MLSTRYKRWFFDIMTILGFFLTALGTYLTYESGSIDSLTNKPIITSALIFVLIALILVYHYYHRSALLSSVLDGRDHTDEAKNLILDLNRNPKSNAHVQKCIESLTDICQEISAAFRKYHESDVAVCIHYVNVDESNKYYVNVLCRNTESKRRHQFYAPHAIDVDYIEENTDFSRLIPKLKSHPLQKLYYINNFLPYSPYYRNSHFSEKNRDRYYGSFGWFYRIFYWELPYKSTIVVPLITSETIGRKIHGFLSIDSPRLWAFSSSYDTPILISLAKAIAPILETYNSRNLLHS